MSTTIWLVACAGPEWCEPKEARRTKKEAEARCEELELTLDPKDVYDSLSTYITMCIPLLEKK